MTDKSNDTRSMALFCDFENVALGVEEARYDKFDIGLVLERLLLKGSITVKKAYCDWERYKAFKAPMHQASFELIEVPHVRQSGKNSADIRMVVDALDLCYTKAHVDTFVIISGDSDFSPLVSKLRENNKIVIGVGVKKSTSDLLMANCDEFIFYDDLVRELKPRASSRKRPARKSSATEATPAAAPPAEAAPADSPAAAPAKASKTSKARKSRKKAASADDVEQVVSTTNADDQSEESLAEERLSRALEAVVSTFEALLAERGEDEPIWGSMVKQTLKRRQPGFNESYYGFRSFNGLLEQAAARGLIALEKDGKSGGYLVRPIA